MGGWGPCDEPPKKEEKSQEEKNPTKDETKKGVPKKEEPKKDAHGHVHAPGDGWGDGGFSPAKIIFFLMVGNIIYNLFFGASSKSKNEVEQDLSSHKKFDETQNQGAEGVNQVPSDDLENNSLDV